MSDNGRRCASILLNAAEIGPEFQLHTRLSRSGINDDNFKTIASKRPAAKAHLPCSFDVWSVRNASLATSAPASGPLRTVR